ncbi:MAG TPA: sigma-70 family RNA polymerase sigma factor [Thermoanaerobaculia bacterium]|nr:sigma-70 family RNA polymerase sigma factor [Thermoanaerobaculia bacterium]
MTGIDDHALAAACRTGDETAWSALVDRYGRRVYGIAYHFTLRKEDAEELSQEIFLKVFENLHRYDGQYAFGAWIVSLARNLCIDQYRRRKREKSFVHVSDESVLPLLSATDDPARNALQKERTKLLFEAIAELPEELSEILILRDLDGLAYDEIGAALELPEGTVKSRLFRARAETARIIRRKTETRSRSGQWKPGALTLAIVAVAS